MKKEQVLSKMREECLVAVIRAKNMEQGEKLVDAIVRGGIHFIEITMTMDEGNPVEFISAMAKKYRGDDRVVIGAGTVLDPEIRAAWRRYLRQLCGQSRPERRYDPAVQPLSRSHASRRDDAHGGDHRSGGRVRRDQDLPGQYSGALGDQLLQGAASSGRVYALRRRGRGQCGQMDPGGRLRRGNGKQPDQRSRDRQL